MRYGRQWVRVIFMRYCQVPTKTEHIQNFKHKLRVHSITLCNITIQIVTHRADWFSCLAFVLLQYMPVPSPNLILTSGRPQISLSKAACGRTAAGCARLVYLAQCFPTFFMPWPTCRFQQNVVAHHHRTIEKSTLSRHLGTNMSKQIMCFAIIHQILFNFSVSNTTQTAR